MHMPHIIELRLQQERNGFHAVQLTAPFSAYINADIPTWRESALSQPRWAAMPYYFLRFKFLTHRMVAKRQAALTLIHYNPGGLSTEINFN